MMKIANLKHCVNYHDSITCNMSSFHCPQFELVYCRCAREKERGEMTISGNKFSAGGKQFRNAHIVSSSLLFAFCGLRGLRKSMF